MDDGEITAMSKAQKLTGVINWQTGRENLSSIRYQLSSEHKRAAFTLLEMLVVIGIIAILSGVGMMGYSRVVKSAKKARTQELVTNAATALTQVLSKNRGIWPKALVTEARGGEGRLDKRVSLVFVRHGLMGLSYNQKSAKDDSSRYELTGKDRCGIVDAEAAAVLKRSASASETSKVPSGGTVKDHVLYYAIDIDGDGITEASINGKSLQIRATAVVWAAGPNGKVEFESRGRNDDVYSWRPTQEKK